MPDLVTVSVTAEDLACGWQRIISPVPTESDRRACAYCPIEHALTRAVGKQVLTNGDEVWLESRAREGQEVSCVILPVAVRGIIRLIDTGTYAEPFTFEIERPR